jgi:hypothetical protein
MRAAAAIIGRHLLFAQDRIRANDRRESGGAKKDVITNTYERRADGIKVLGPSAPVFLLLLTGRMEFECCRCAVQARRQAKRRGQAKKPSVQGLD